MPSNGRTVHLGSQDQAEALWRKLLGARIPPFPEGRWRWALSGEALEPEDLVLLLSGSGDRASLHWALRAHVSAFANYEFEDAPFVGFEGSERERESSVWNHGYWPSLRRKKCAEALPDEE